MKKLLYLLTAALSLQFFLYLYQINSSMQIQQVRMVDQAISNQTGWSLKQIVLPQLPDKQEASQALQDLLQSAQETETAVSIAQLTTDQGTQTVYRTYLFLPEDLRIPFDLVQSKELSSFLLDEKSCLTSSDTLQDSESRIHFTDHRLYQPWQWRYEICSIASMPVQLLEEGPLQISVITDHFPAFREKLTKIPSLSGFIVSDAEEGDDHFSINLFFEIALFAGFGMLLLFLCLYLSERTEFMIRTLHGQSSLRIVYCLMRKPIFTCMSIYVLIQLFLCLIGTSGFESENRNLFLYSAMSCMFFFLLLLAVGGIYWLCSFFSKKTRFLKEDGMIDEFSWIAQTLKVFFLALVTGTLASSVLMVSQNGLLLKTLEEKKKSLTEAIALYDISASSLEAQQSEILDAENESEDDLMKLWKMPEWIHIELQRLNEAEFSWNYALRVKDPKEQQISLLLVNRNAYQKQIAPVLFSQLSEPVVLSSDNEEIILVPDSLASRMLIDQNMSSQVIPYTGEYEFTTLMASHDPEEICVINPVIIVLPDYSRLSSLGLSTDFFRKEDFPDQQTLNNRLAQMKLSSINTTDTEEYWNLIVDETKELILENASLILILLIIAFLFDYVCAAFYLQLNKQKLTIELLHGRNSWRMNRSYWLQFAITYSFAQLIAIIFLHTSPVAALVTLMVLACMDLIVSLVLFYRFEHRNVLLILKGDEKTS